MYVYSHKESPKHSLDPKSLKTSLPPIQGSLIDKGSERWRRRCACLLRGWQSKYGTPSRHQGLNPTNSMMQPSLNLGSAIRLKPNGDAQSHCVENYHQHSIFNKGWQGNDMNHKGLVRKLRRHFRRKLAASGVGSRKCECTDPRLGMWQRFQGVAKGQFHTMRVFGTVEK